MKMTVLFIVLIFIFGCSTGVIKVQSEQSKETGTKYSRSQEVVSTQEIASFSSQRSKLNQIKKLYYNSQFEMAAKKLMDLKDRGLKQEIREEVLFLLGMIYGNGTNPDKDYDKALFYLGELIKFNPNTKFKSDAIFKKETILKLKDKQK